MIAALLVTAIVLSLLLLLCTFVQHLYLESLRLRARESAALVFFKETLEDRLGLKTDTGALAFSLVKHTLLLLLGIVFLAAAIPGVALGLAILEAAVFSFLVMVACAYLGPQLLYRKTGGTWLLPLLPLLKLLALIARPFTILFGFLQSLAELGEPEAKRDENGRSNEDIDALISAGEEEGIFEKDDRRLIESVVAFGDKTVREVMTPRPNIVAISKDETLEGLRQLVINEQYSRIPVFENSIDQIIGFIHVRDMFEIEAEDRDKVPLAQLIRPIKSVPETKPVHDLFREMQEDGTHMAVVIDEYGNTAGLATMEDLVEEVFGEIRDEHEPTRDIEKIAENTYLVSGSFDLDHLYDLLHFRPEEETESTTVGGLVAEWLGRVPQPGEAVEREGIRLEVVAGNEFRVDRVRISKSPGTVNA